MPRPYVNDPKRLNKFASPDLMRVLLIGCGWAALLGFLSGLVWIGYTLLRLHVFN